MLLFLLRLLFSHSSNAYVFHAFTIFFRSVLFWRDSDSEYLHLNSLFESVKFYLLKHVLFRLLHFFFFLALSLTHAVSSHIKFRVFSFVRCILLRVLNRNEMEWTTNKLSLPEFTFTHKQNQMNKKIFCFCIFTIFLSSLVQIDYWPRQCICSMWTTILCVLYTWEMIKKCKNKMKQQQIRSTNFSI